MLRNLLKNNQSFPDEVRTANEGFQNTILLKNLDHLLSQKYEANTNIPSP